MQTKKDSILETIANTVVGFLINIAVAFVILPLYGMEEDFTKSLEITLIFTVASFVRNYIVRRIFNKQKGD